MTQRVSKAIDAFLDALNENRLDIASTCGCAVGTLLREGMLEKHAEKYTICHDELYLKECSPSLPVNNSIWIKCFITATKTPISTPEENEVIVRDGDVKSQTKFTGAEAMKIKAQILPLVDFSEEELMQIEWAFETANGPDTYIYTREARIKALEAAVAVMLTFDEDTTTDVKEVFTSKAELISA